MLKIVYACNDKLFEGVYLSILSMLNRTKEELEIFCLSGDLTNIKDTYIGLTKEHEKIIDDLVKKYSPNNSFKVLDCSKKYLDAISNTKDFDVWKYTPYTNFRLLLESFPEVSGKVLYIDADTMVNGDIKQAFDVDMNGVEACACHDRNLGKRNNNMYFNAGVILLNMDQIRKTHYLQKALDYYVTYKPKMADQQALNSVWTKIIFWPDEYRFNYQKPKIEENTVIKHFLNTARLIPWYRYIKQWDIKKVQNTLKMHNWDKDYEFFLAEKAKWGK